MPDSSAVPDAIQLPARAAAAEESRAAHARFLQTKIFGSLDGLRAIAILAVLWHHAPRAAESRFVLAGRGFLGVDLFFVISGFLIVTLLLRERRRHGAVSLRHFYARRFLRIFPAYYLTLALVAAQAFLTHGNTAPALRHDLPYAVFYVSNLVPMLSLLSITWSLSAEEQFYLVVPALEKWLGRGMAIFLPVAYVLVCLPPLGFEAGWHLPGFFRQTTFGPILLGVMLAHALDDPRGYGWLWRLLRHPASPLGAAVLVIAACCQPAADITGWPRIGVHAALLLLVASCVVREAHALQPLLRLPPLRRIGVVSYGIYLYHMLVRHFVDKAAQGFAPSGAREVILFGALALVSWGVAEASFRLFETRFLTLKKRFSD
jgi:peptidoglycan/LPS O-acetylase OafA/YrhL